MPTKIPLNSPVVLVWNIYKEEMDGSGVMHSVYLLVYIYVFTLGILHSKK